MVIVCYLMLVPALLSLIMKPPDRANGTRGLTRCQAIRSITGLVGKWLRLLEIHDRKSKNKCLCCQLAENCNYLSSSVHILHRSHRSMCSTLLYITGILCIYYVMVQKNFLSSARGVFHGRHHESTIRLTHTDETFPPRAVQIHIVHIYRW